MRVRVHFSVDTETGEVAQFVVEDISVEPEPEHDAAHDRIAYEVGKVVERRPAPQQVVPGEASALTYQPGDELPTATERETARE
jgi:hypothetical protein